MGEPQFRQRVGVKLGDEVKYGAIIEKWADSLASVAFAGIQNTPPSPHGWVVRVWLDGESRPMAEMIPYEKLYER